MTGHSCIIDWQCASESSVCDAEVRGTLCPWAPDFGLCCVMICDLVYLQWFVWKNARSLGGTFTHMAGAVKSRCCGDSGGVHPQVA